MSKLTRVLLLALASFLVAPAVADAEFGVVPGSMTTALLDSAGDPEVRAGAHPDRFTTGFDLNLDGDVVDGNLRDMAIDLPAGLVGDSNAVTRCTREQFSVGGFDDVLCPDQSQVGIAMVHLAAFGEFPAVIYNVEPATGNLAEFGFKVILASGALTARLRPDGRSLRLEVRNLIQDVPLEGIDVELWGVPADHQADPGPRRAFLTNPTHCDGSPTTVSLRARSWQEPDVWRTAEASAPPIVGCDDLGFGPGLGMTLDSSSANTLIGPEIEISVPQNDDPDGLSTARIKAIDLLLPEGFALSPGTANGRQACSDEAAAVGTDRSAACPATSRLGSVEMESPLLTQPLTGAVYLGQHLEGTAIRVFIVADVGDAQVKLVGSMTPDPQTGRIRTVISDVPELPFSRIALTFRRGAHAPLVTPMTCGSGDAVATFTPHGGAAATASTAVTIDRGALGAPCLASLPFAPSVTGGTSSVRAGAPSAFSMTVRRQDGEQLLERFQFDLPPGLIARLSAVGSCADTALAVGACPTSSRIGSAIAEAGSGASPFALGGDVFLTGPYRGAPFGAAIVMRALVGPFDLGLVIVRAALTMNADTGRLTGVSDTVPQMVAGIPLRLQTIGLDIDRPGFILNPTSCRPSSISSTITSTGGVVSRSNVRFGLTGCSRLRLRSKLAVALTGRSQLRRGGHPGLTLAISAKPGGSNLSGGELRLPSILQLGQPAVSAICSREQATDGRCPAGSIVGKARGRSPVIPGVLNGSLYLVQPQSGLFPELWGRLEGQGIALNVHMRIVTKGGRTTTKLVDVPDLPLAAFTMRIPGGAKGLFSTPRSPCAGGRARRMLVTGTLKGHSGARRDLQVPVRAKCPSRRK